VLGTGWTEAAALAAAFLIAGIAVFSVFWAMGDLDDEQALSLLIGTALASILSGATVYGSGVNVGLGAERLNLAVKAEQSQAD
jgi:hypothetical protein